MRPDLRVYELKVSPYERVAGMLLALLALIGVSVLIMFLLWLTSQIFARNEPVPAQLQDIGTGEGGIAGGMELDAPMAEELGLETELEEPSLKDTLAAVADAVATDPALLDDPALTDEILTGRGGSTGRGGRFGTGDGTGGGIRRNWEVRFAEGNTLQTYARQLDHFQIELAVVIQEENRLICARNLASSRPDTYSRPADQEKRYYLTWRRGGLQQADRALLDKANVPHRGRIIVKFIPPKLEAQLADMELKRAGGDLANVRKTTFGILPERSGYRFYIIDQI